MKYPLASAPTPSVPIYIAQSDGSKLNSSQTTLLPIQTDRLDTESLTARIVPKISIALVSMGKFCDNGCIGILTHTDAYVLKGEQTTKWMANLPSEDSLLNGYRDFNDRLWHLPLSKMEQHPNEVPENDYEHHSCHSMRFLATIANRVAYYHACMGSPTISTWCDAIEAGHLATFPLLTAAQVRKYAPQSVAMHMGHLDQVQSNRLSTKQHSQTSRVLYVGVVEDIRTNTTLHRQGTIYSDTTGRFIVTSSQGNKYILVVFDGDSNYIFAEPIPSRTAAQILKAYTKIQDLLISRGITPHIHICDNEASTSLKTYLTSKGIQYQLVAPNQHRANAAERAIRTFKNHFIATLCSCDPNFPLADPLAS